MSEPVVQFTDDMRRENIKSLSWYLLKKYLEGGDRCPVLLKVLTDYVNDCKVAEDCFAFVKMLSLLVLSEQVEPKEEGTKLAVIKNIYDTLIELRGHCGKQLEQPLEKLDQLIAEARCQVIVSHLMYDNVDSALSHWRDFYADKNYAEDPLSSQLHQILQYLSEDSYRKKRDEKMNLSINLFFMEHELSSLCKDVRMFVELCCSNILKPPKTIKYNLRSASNYYPGHTSTAKSPTAIATVAKKAAVSEPATRSVQLASPSHTTSRGNGGERTGGEKTVRVSVRSRDLQSTQLEVVVERAQKSPTRKAVSGPQVTRRRKVKAVLREAPVERMASRSPVKDTEAESQVEMDGDEAHDDIGQMSGLGSNQGGVVQATPTTADAEPSPHTRSPQKRKQPSSETPPQGSSPRKVLPRNAKRKPAKSAVDTSEYDFTTSEDEDVIMQPPDVTLETTPISKLPARLTPVHFKRAYLTAGNSKQDAAKSSPKQTFLGFKKPQKKKVKFSVQETEYLMAGIKRYGFGNWAVILSKYPFHPSRDKVSLKDKARNLRGR